MVRLGLWWVAGCLLLSACIPAARGPQGGEAAVPVVKLEGSGQQAGLGQRAPEIAWEKKGKKIFLSDFRGKPVVLVFTATWCPACSKMTPELVAFRKRIEDEAMLYLVFSAEDPRAVASYLEEKKATELAALADVDQSVSAAYGIAAVPTVVFIDADGILAEQKVGWQSAETLLQVLEKIGGP